MGLFSDLQRAYQRGRAQREAEQDRAAPFDQPPPDDEPRAAPFNDPSDFFDLGDDDKVAGLLREIRDLKELLALAAEENASLKEQLAGAGDDERRQAADQRTRERMRELESILAWPGVRRALEKVLHPDTGEGGSTITRTEICQTMHAVMDRLGIRL